MSSRCRYLSGTIKTTGTRRHLIVDDGRTTHGFMVTALEIWPVYGHQIGDISVTIATKANGASLPMQAEDNRQVAWAYSAADSQGIPIATILRPEEVVLEELIIYAEWTDGYVGGYNYLIKLEPVVISDSQAALVLINNKAQDLS